MQPSAFQIETASLPRVDEMTRVQRAAYPELDEETWFLKEHYIAHIGQFPEGQFLAIETATGRLAGAASSARVDMDKDVIEHSYDDKLGSNFLNLHKAEGEWLYGADMCVDPVYQGRGISKFFFDAWKNYTRERNMKGIVFGSILHGYGAVKNQMSAEEYVAKVSFGKIFDPTLSVHLRRKFRIRGIIQHYFDIEAYDNKAAFLQWDNPDYTPTIGVSTRKKTGSRL